MDTKLNKLQFSWVERKRSAGTTANYTRNQTAKVARGRGREREREYNFRFCKRNPKNARGDKALSDNLAVI